MEGADTVSGSEEEVEEVDDAFKFDDGVPNIAPPPTTSSLQLLEAPPAVAVDES